MNAASIVFGDSIWTIRSLPLASGVATVLLGRHIASRMYTRRAGDLTGILLLTVPSFAGNSFLMTPDTLLAVCWVLGIFTSWKAIKGHRPVLWWCLTGVVCGLGLLSKYNMILFFLGLGLYWLIEPQHRRNVFLGTLGAGLIALCLFSPVLIWNLENDWLSFRFQLAHGFESEGPAFYITLAEYAGGLLLAATPFLAIMSFYSAGRVFFMKDSPSRFLASFFWAVIVFFGLSALRTSVGPNWPMLAFFSGFVLCARDWDVFPKWLRYSAAAFVALYALVAFVGFTYLATPGDFFVKYKGEPLTIPRGREFTGGEELARKISSRAESQNTDFVAVKSHQLFGRLAYFSPQLRPKLWLLLEGWYRFPWVDYSKWKNGSATIVCGSKKDVEQIDHLFERIEPASTIEYGEKGKTRKMFLFRGSGYRPQVEENGEE
jgi:4-amino-4-deoxy-L-arabinose transferase-like glycosyltransferase